MAEQLKKKFDTIIKQNDAVTQTVNTVVAKSVQITIQPEINTPDCIESFINNTPDNKHYNNVPIQTGELCVFMKNQQSSNIDFDINSKGELIVNGENAKNYSMSDEGELIYTYR